MDIFFLMRSDLTNNKQQLIYLFPLPTLPNDSPSLLLDRIVDLLQTMNPRNQNFSCNRGRGRGRSFFSNNRPAPRLICQVCHKPGHSATSCWYRFDQSYQAETNEPAAYMATSSTGPNYPWFHDTGTTHQVTNELSNLNLRTEEYTGTDQLQVGNGQGLRIHHSGIANLSSLHHNFRLSSLLHVPEITKNLLSVNKFTKDNNVFIEFHPTFFCVKDIPTRTPLLHGPSKDGLYLWPFSRHSSTKPAAYHGEKVPMDRWHQRLGHPAPPIVRHVIRNHNLPVSSSRVSSVCSSCQQGKSHRLHFSLSNSVSSNPLELLFLDVWGPAPMLSMNNKRFFLCIVDDFSKYVWIFPLSQKSDVYATFLRFKILVENYFNSKIKSVQSDNGGEFRPLQSRLPLLGISYRLSCPHTHHQMGSVERKHRHIVETGLSLLATANVPLYLWDEAFNSATYLINRLPSKITKNKSPYELLFKVTPDYKFLKVFGCEYWPFTCPYNQHKLDYRSKSCVFLGYCKDHHGYKCLHIPSGKIYLARHVVFNETSFPFKHSQTNQQPSPPSVVTPTSFTFPISLYPTPTETNTTATSSPPTETNQSSPITNPHTSPPLPTVTAPIIIPSATSDSHTASIPSEDERVPTPLTRTHEMTTRSQNQIFKPKLLPTGMIRYPPSAFTTTLCSAATEPTCYIAAAKDANWRHAMNAEFDALLKNGTWSLVPFSPSMNVVGSKWVFRIKRKADGSIERYKARLVAKGFHQQPGVDFDETYSLVVKPITIRTVLTIAVTHDWAIHQIDVSNAFLHGVIKENVYMLQPPGFTHPNFPNVVCKLHKALYGLKQAPRAWFDRLSSRLHELKFKDSKSDSSLFIYKCNGVTIFVLIYVDDIIITSSHQAAIPKLIADLQLSFAIKDLGPLHFFLGIEAIWTKDALHLSQQRYIHDLLTKTNMMLAKPISSPMSASSPLSKFDGSTITDPSLYRSTVGSLQYLSITRPDLSFAVNKVSQFM
jgi:hypothetical protein